EAELRRLTASAPDSSDPGTLIRQGSLNVTLAHNSAAGNTLLDQAAKQLLSERASFFDARNRGTVLEQQINLFEELAVGYLAAHRDEAAFSTLENARGRGLEDLSYILAQGRLSGEDRGWLAQQVRLDAEVGAVERKITDHTVAEGTLPQLPKELSRWEP